MSCVTIFFSASSKLPKKGERGQPRWSQGAFINRVQVRCDHPLCKKQHAGRQKTLSYDAHARTVSKIFLCCSKASYGSAACLHKNSTVESTSHHHTLDSFTMRGKYAARRITCAWNKTKPRLTAILLLCSLHRLRYSDSAHCHDHVEIQTQPTGSLANRAIHS